jgi:hypothetical protein
MKSYADVIKLAAEQAFHTYMSGSYAPWQQVDFDLIAFIYEVPSKQVAIDAGTVYDALQEEQFKQFKVMK